MEKPTVTVIYNMCALGDMIYFLNQDLGPFRLSDSLFSKAFILPISSHHQKGVGGGHLEAVLCSKASDTLMVYLA